MASIKFNTINPYSQITETTINFSGTMSYDTWTFNGTKRREIGSSVVIKINGAVMKSFSLTEEQVSFNTEKFENFIPGSSATVTLQLYYHQQYQTTATIYAFKVYVPFDGWKLLEYDTKDDARADYVDLLEYGYSVWPTSIQDSSIIEYEGVYLVETTKIGWETQYFNNMIEESKIFYLKPNKFYFNDTGPLSAGTKIYLNQSLSKSLPNIYKFNEVATQWRRWNKQTSAGNSCNAFQKGSNLSAIMLNAAHSYIGTKYSYQRGDKVNLQMFKELENKLNE